MIKKWILTIKLKRNIRKFGLDLAVDLLRDEIELLYWDIIEKALKK